MDDIVPSQIVKPATENADKKLILVAEDDLFYAKIYETKLTSEGFDVEVVPNGDEALKHINERKPDLLLLDLIMPIMDGFQVLESIKNNDKYKDLKIIVLSNLGQEEDIKKAKSYGVNDYLVKADISIQDLIKKVHDTLNQQTPVNPAP
jgi:DNA-binding response OmpR family regulator